jgi:hypothetical protein
MDDWISVHAFHQGDLDTLLSKAVVPIVDWFADSGSCARWFFLRYWEGGPHLRLRARPTPGHANEVREYMMRSLHGYLRANPSEPALDAAAYERLAAELAGREHLTSYERTLRPNDSVAPVPYRPEYTVYGTGRSMAATERHFAQSSQIALRVVASGMPRARRTGMCLSASLLALAVLEPDLARVAKAFAATVADWDVRAPYPPEFSARLDSAFVDRRTALRMHAARVWELTSVAGPGQADPGQVGLLAREPDLACWLASLRELHGTLENIARDGGLPSEPAPSPYSPCLAYLSGDQRVMAGILLRCVHLLANRMGLTVPDESQVIYLVCRTLADFATCDGRLTGEEL